jgi:hypothetical protein
MSAKTKRKPAKRDEVHNNIMHQKPKKAVQGDKPASAPDLYALRQLLRSDRKRTGGWVLMGKPKGVYA